jgi:hypothetical protein
MFSIRAPLISKKFFSITKSIKLKLRLYNREMKKKFYPQQDSNPRHFVALIHRFSKIKPKIKNLSAVGFEPTPVFTDQNTHC